MSAHHIDLLPLFDVTRQGSVTLSGNGFQRRTSSVREGLELIIDSFDDSNACCAFVRFTPKVDATLEIAVAGEYSAASAMAGGWVLRPTDTAPDLYWIPLAPILRKLDTQAHVLTQSTATSEGLEVSASRLSVSVAVPAGHSLDVVIWRIPQGEADLVATLDTLGALERQQYFLWSSHTTYARPADLYQHLVHGHVYENHAVWPRYWRVCSELDAYALYLVLSGLARATGRRYYALVKRQVVFSVIARQSGDGGWYHGEWTDRMESHYRLHTGGTLMLADYFEESGDTSVGAALEKAVTFSVRATDRLERGVWFLHDSLEQDHDSASKYPFRWVQSRAFGKSPTNMLILNTHLDTTIAIERYQRVSDNRIHSDLVASAREITHTILDNRPAEWLYRPLFRAIGLTFLPSADARALPLPKRAIKRIAWKYLIPLLPRIKALFPRLVMPGGFIDRALAQAGMSYRYQPVNLLDLIRTRRIFDDARLDAMLDESFAFTQHSGIRRRWKELRGNEDDSLGFWCEALYHLCLAHDDSKYRAWLAEAMLDLSDNALGLSPSLLGANREAIPDDQQAPCPIPVDHRLRVANLSRNGSIEVIVVNPTAEDIPFAWAVPPGGRLDWVSATGPDDAAVAPRRGWLWGTGPAAADTQSAAHLSRNATPVLIRTAQ